MKQFLWLLPFLLFSCSDPEEREDFSVEGMQPVYLEGEAWNEIFAIEAQPIKKLGKIYYKDNHIFVNELDRGIHVINNTDPNNPEPIKFIKIWGSRDIAIKGNILYADNVSDLVAIDISDLNNVFVTKRIENLYPANQSAFPENYQGYFECVNPDNGIVIAWETAILNSPKCFR